MKAHDPNLALLESVVAALGPLSQRFVFVGGCVTGLLVTEDANPTVRATRDVDAIVQVVSLGEYHALERQHRRCGFAPRSQPRSTRLPLASRCRTPGCHADRQGGIGFRQSLVR